MRRKKKPKLVIALPASAGKSTALFALADKLCRLGDDRSDAEVLYNYKTKSQKLITTKADADRDDESQRKAHAR